MTNTDQIEEQATQVLDAILPRRDPRYDAAHEYLTVFLSTDPATRRLAMRALKASSPGPEHDQAAHPLAAGGAPESGEDKEGAAAPHAAEGAKSDTVTVASGTSHSKVDGAQAFSPAGTQSGQPQLSCGGPSCRSGKHGIEVHNAQDPSCTHIHPPKRVAHAR